MPFARYSVMNPKAGQEDRVSSLVDRLLDFHRGREGYVAGYRLGPDVHATNTLVGRFSVWESEADANATAMQDQNTAIRSELMGAIEEDSHQELTFQVDYIPPA